MSEMAPPPPPRDNYPVAMIGDIGVSQTSVIVPQGTFPIKGTTWLLSDMSREEDKISTLGIVLAIVGFFFVCILSLLFLLMKEKRVTGQIQVSVQGSGFAYATVIPVHDRLTAERVNQQVVWARSVAALAG